MQIETGTYGIEFDFYFVVIQAGSNDFAATGDWTPATGDVKISKDGGNVANTTNLPSAVGGTGSVLWKQTLTATEMQATDIGYQIVDSATKAIEDQAILVTTRLSGQVQANKGIIIFQVDTGTLTPSTTAWEATRIWPNATEETTADHYLSRNVLWATGNLAGSQKNITDYELANSKEKYTCSAFVEAPASGDIGVVL